MYGGQGHKLPWYRRIEGVVTQLHPGFDTGQFIHTVPAPPSLKTSPLATNQQNYPPQQFGFGIWDQLHFFTPIYQRYQQGQSLPPYPVAHQPIQHQPQYIPQQQQAATAPPTAPSSLTTSFFGNAVQDAPSSPSSTEDKIRAILKIVPQASPHDARKALSETSGDLDDALCKLIDWRTEENAKTQEAQQVCASTAFVVFPAQQGSLGISSYPDWLRSGAVLTNTLNHSMTTALASTFPPSGRQKALLIAINYDGTKDELSGPRQDVRRMGAMLEKVYGFRSDNTVELTDARENYKNPIYLPTKKNILKAMEWLVKDAQTGDVLFFHYSGHGSQKPSLDGYTYEQDGLDETICPLDFRKAGEIRDDEMASIMQKDLPAGVRLFCVMDCCHSGTGLDLPYVCDVEDDTWIKLNTKYKSKGDVTLLAGCQSDQTSADLTLRCGKRAGGALTLALLSALSMKPFRHTYHTLISTTMKSLKERGFKQIIQLSSSIPFDCKKRPFR
eukprot:Protomagalhaensia_wolfi_Nauph_80__5126@NODE_547_length_2329_cov_13_934934_g407_i0_p1_GENE_NODE_547_length_2329_cov_13_934934_g407_i0NODE_547_length_2329_cov_13_934934_g407_i0_p1_ORF_typecomplete_len500_score91_42Peptidase_C14/PF00656_22/5_5e58Raptor_N/PF14538_6/8_1e05Peptidase_C13/PF01650_18/0_0064DUF1296/PF06972_11/0_17HOIPUBA/PF16678_5/0_21G_path_suppress/PF15991_5/5_9DUF3824/PF12868_7/6_8e03DUF3824/PF12868_7/0_43_NODE_547_length_2329_cov_13_934934_g407_i0681567